MMDNNYNNNAAKAQTFVLNSDGTYSILANSVCLETDSSENQTRLSGQFIIEADTLARIIAIADNDKLVDIEDCWGDTISVYSNKGSLKELGERYERLRYQLDRLEKEISRYNKLPFWKKMIKKIKINLN